jgi:hypothetical protein
MTVKSLATHDIAIRAYKTFVQVVAAQAVVYGSLQGDGSPPVQQTAAVSLAATLVAVAWNLALAWFTKTKNAKLDTLAAAIDKIVDEAQPSTQPSVVAP